MTGIETVRIISPFRQPIQSTRYFFVSCLLRTQLPPWANNNNIPYVNKGSNRVYGLALISASFLITTLKHPKQKACSIKSNGILQSDRPSQVPQRSPSFAATCVALGAERVVFATLLREKG